MNLIVIIHKIDRWNASSKMFIARVIMADLDGACFAYWTGASDMAYDKLLILGDKEGTHAISL